MFPHYLGENIPKKGASSTFHGPYLVSRQFRLANPILLSTLLIQLFHFELDIVAALKSYYGVSLLNILRYIALLQVFSPLIYNPHNIS